MPLTHDFKETIRARAQADSEFRQALLREAIECFINGAGDRQSGAPQLCQRDCRVSGLRETYSHPGQKSDANVGPEG